MRVICINYNTVKINILTVLNIQFYFKIGSPYEVNLKEKRLEIYLKLS
jgi:hypothetical protein